jgi:LysM repeat protein
VPTDAGFALQRRPEIIRAWVEEIAPQVGQARRLDVEATYQRLLASLDAGEGQTAAEIYHPPLTYTVDFGDTFYDIAYGFGFPQWHLEQANPDVEPGQIDVGQVLTIPSLDVLFPHPLVDHKRIEIDLPTQTLYAFEDNTQIFEFKVSSGISSTPTIAGQFQVLFKEEAAFAQRWSLDMPYFMGFYEEGEGFYNGIHELPITSRGVRLPSGVLGWPASYGCIILDEGDAESLYRWADVGTLVRVKGVAPGTPYGQQTLSDIAPPTPQEASP